MLNGLKRASPQLVGACSALRGIELIFDSVLMLALHGGRHCYGDPKNNGCNPAYAFDEVSHGSKEEWFVDVDSYKIGVNYICTNYHD